MSNLSHLKVLILEKNNLTKLTTNSLDKNTPEIEYKVVKKEDCTESKIGTALLNTQDITLVVTSGLVLELKDGDFPDIEKLKQYDICVSREGVFTDHKRLNEHYRYAASHITDGVIDLSIFIINPDMWDEIPEKDQGVLHDKKKMFIPRYMNHKNDILFQEDSTAAVDAFNYGVLGEQASVYNYVDCIYKNDINILEIYAYCFDKLIPYIKRVPRKEQNRIKLLANKTKQKIKTMRKKMHDLNQQGESNEQSSKN
jgi:hypothetical protein